MAAPKAQKSFASFEEMLKVMSSADRPSKLIEWPAPDGEKSFSVRLWALSDIEFAEATLAAQDWVFDPKRGMGASPITVEMQRSLFDAEEERQILARALRNADKPGEPLVADVDDLRRVLTPDARRLLMRMYNAWADECSPIRELEAMDPAEAKRMLLDFQRAGELSGWLDSCDFGSLKRFVQQLVAL